MLAWRLFYELASLCLTDMGNIRAMPISEIASWLDFHGIYDRDERLKISRHVRRLEAVYKERRRES